MFIHILCRETSEMLVSRDGISDEFVFKALPVNPERDSHKAHPEGAGHPETAPQPWLVVEWNSSHGGLL